MYVSQHLPEYEKKKVLSIGSKALHEELENFNIEHETLDAFKLSTSCKVREPLQFYEELDLVELDPNVGVIITGFDREINYNKLSLASLYLQNGAKWILTNDDAYGMTPEKQRRTCGNGCLAAFLEFGLKMPDGTLICEKVTTGKPNKDIVKMIMTQHNIDISERSKFLMVGDTPATDMAMGNNNNIDTCMVLTGIVASLEE